MLCLSSTNDFLSIFKIASLSSHVAFSFPEKAIVHAPCSRWKIGREKELWCIICCPLVKEMPSTRAWRVLEKPIARSRISETSRPPGSINKFSHSPNAFSSIDNSFPAGTKKKHHDPRHVPSSSPESNDLHMYVCVSKIRCCQRYRNWSRGEKQEGKSTCPLGKKTLTWIYSRVH